ncbi:riboflavin synthase [Thalassoroseus pseudoceratinae]|uniref:riboflavin synthase n=1 Tax=Thalassoroseus pseudoceratinae TaxID=2713176 RepID=UPI001423D902|nr:riboflavin synthase [Thalassoroseus pseudoceratinae]
MFTGLVEGCGRVQRIQNESAGIRLGIDMSGTPLGEACVNSDHPDGTDLGASIALNGCCLTVVAREGMVLDFQAGSETLSKTNLGRLAVGDRVNVERSLAVGGRLGGHFVQGHVDGQGTVTAIETEPGSDGQEWVFMTFQIPSALARLMVSKGSVAVDGVSLTVVDPTAESFRVALIPHTLDATTLGTRAVGDAVNIEADMLGKYVAKLLATPTVEDQ